MKPYALISLILLVAFMWSCENKSQSPLSPEDLTTLAKDGGSGTVTATAKGGKGKGKVDKDATYLVEITFGGAPGGIHTGAAMTNPTVFKAKRMKLNLTVLNLLPCFSFTSMPKVEGIFQIAHGYSIGFWFTANECTYIMWMPIVNMPETWPPAGVGDTVTFTGSKLNVVMANNPKCENPCEGTVTLPSDWTVVVTKISE